MFGWEDCHLYQFSDNGFDSELLIAEKNEELENDYKEVLEAGKIPLSQIFVKKGDTYTYIYDFGDCWQHTILLEQLIPEVSYMPELIDGQGACPPEDSGGVMGYKNMLEILADQNHPEYYEYLEWLGLGEDESWDPDEFDLEYFQEVLTELFAC